MRNTHAANAKCRKFMQDDAEFGGGGGIRTHETLSGLTVFKTAGVNRFPTPP